MKPWRGYNHEKYFNFTIVAIILLIVVVSGGCLTLKMTKLPEIPKEYFLENAEESTIKDHMRRIIEAKKKAEIESNINYINKLVSKDIDFKTFLQERHKQIVKESAQLFLFNDKAIFLEVDMYLSRMTGEIDKTSYDVEHESEHYENADKCGIEAYYAIRVIVESRVGKKWKFKTGPSLVPLIEKKAIEKDWTLKDYTNALRVVVNVSDMSSGDLKTIEAIEAIEKITSEEN